MSDKVHLDRAHVHHLLAADDPHPPFRGEMRRALPAQKILGFLHLYDGEEAVSVGVIEALETAGRRRCHLS